MLNKTSITRIAILLIILCNIGCDQLSKHIVRKEVAYNDVIKIGLDNITLTKVENTGAFLSIGSVLPYYARLITLIILPCLVLAGCMYYILKYRSLSRLFVIGIAFVIGGGIGNLYDRIAFGSVTDFLHIDFVIFQTGVFNAADLSIMAGMVMILISMYGKKQVRMVNQP